MARPAGAQSTLLPLVRRRGLQVAESRLNRVVDDEVPLPKRFDRDWIEAGCRRNRMVRALTLPQAEDGATDRCKRSDLVLADELRRISVQPARIFDAVPTSDAVPTCWEASLAVLHPRPYLDPEGVG